MTDGVLLIHKPIGITSFDVVAKVRRLFGTKQVGHTCNASVCSMTR